MNVTVLFFVCVQIIIYKQKKLDQKSVTHKHLRNVYLLENLRAKHDNKHCQLKITTHFEIFIIDAIANGAQNFKSTCLVELQKSQFAMLPLCQI